jgi:mobilome CxxCx(11)CxxC protein
VSNVDNREDEIRNLRQRSWDQAIHAFGTGYIFEQRARSFQWRTRALTFWAIGVPLAVGASVMSFGVNPRTLPYILSVAGALGLTQVVASGWSLVARWDEGLAYARESMRDNYSLSEQYRRLGQDAPRDLALRLELLDVADGARRNLDLIQTISGSERRMGLRAALRQFSRPCAGCGQVPTAMKPSECDVCGNF